MKYTSVFLLFLSFVAKCQVTLPLNDLSSFETKSKNWSIAGDVTADINKENLLTAKPGSGILVCQHEKGKYGTEYELFTKNQFGDLDLEFDFMLSKGSNSGVYLQGRYEIQLYDSWGKGNKYSDCGGIYERWNDAMPEGQKGYEGYAPRFNVTKAPGLWQSMKISFQAPRFDSNGKKIANAKILYIILNDQLIHENVELSGATRGAIGEESILGPLRIQGDHGSVAFKNIILNSYDKTAGEIHDLNYKVYLGSFAHDADLSKLKIDKQGKTDDLTWEVTPKDNDYVFVIKGKYTAPSDGKYTFTSQIAGNSTLKIDGKEILDNKWTVSSQTREATLELKAGEHDIEVFNNKRDGWLKPALGLWSAGPGFRSTPHHSVGSLIAAKPVDPIIITPSNTPILRSFMDFNKGDYSKRIVHAISVGSNDNIHYTYDNDKGAILQVWRGKFLNATPMWNDRGDGSSKPIGSVVLLNNDLLLAPNSNAIWPKDTVGSGFKPTSYSLDENDRPTFKYKIAGTTVSDKIQVIDAKYIQREITIENPASMLISRLAEGKNIELISEGLYAIDNKNYYIKLDKYSDAKIRNGNELLVSPVENNISYAIIF